MVTLPHDYVAPILVTLAAETPAHCQGHDGPCERTDAEWHHQNTMYVEERANWVYMCPDCAKARDAAWQEMWDEYNSSRF
jgi:hypothetical protein